MDDTDIDPLDGSPRGAEKKEAYHRACEAEVKSFKVRRPEDVPLDRKALVRLAGNDRENVVLQILNEGGDNNLHYHANMDSVFFVLKGSIKFYGPDDVVIGEYHANEGLVMPAGARYWFEKTGTEEAHLFQVATYAKGRKMSKRIDASPRKANMEGSFRMDEHGNRLGENEKV